MQDAIETFYEGERVEALPEPSPLDALIASGSVQGGAVVMVDVHFDFLDTKSVPVNITLPVWLRNRIDKAAKAAGMNRSRYIAKAAQAFEA